MSDKENDIPNEVMDYIKDEVQKIGYGQVTIELNEKNKFIDVVTERRKRFEKGKKKEIPDNMQPGIRNG